MGLVQSALTLLSCLLACYLLSGISNAQNNVTIRPSLNQVTGSPENRATELKNNRSIRTGKPAKLTMKQGLIMNQVIATYVLDSSRDGLCRKHNEEFKKGLRSLEGWALQMFDSSSKLQSGILMGNVVEYGASKQCLRIYKETENGPVRGKHCSFRIIPGEKLLRAVTGFRNISHKHFNKIKKSVIEGVRLIWSVCIPDSCPASEVLNHFNKTLMDLAHGLEITITLTEENCMTLAGEPRWTYEEYSFLIFAGGVFFAVATCTVIDYARPNSGEVIKIFSAISNGRKLLAKENKNTEMTCLHGIKFFSTLYVLYGHRYLTDMLFPPINSLDLIEWINKYTSTIVIGGTVAVDSFLFVSALLVSYNFFENLSKTGKFNAPRFYISRYCRITLPLLVTVIIYGSFIQHFGSGPIWKDACFIFQEPCRRFWWSTLLHIQSYINPGFLCIPQVWYLTCDMLYYCVSPFIMYPLWKWPVLGYINLTVLYVLSVGINFYLAWINKYPGGGVPLTNRFFATKYFQRHYIAPHVRASPYLIGLGFGYAIFKTKDTKIHMGIGVNIVGWLLTILAMSSSVVGSHVFQLENHDYNRMESSLYLSCARSGWVFGVAWIVWSCMHGYGGFVNELLSLHVFRVLGRTGYGIFLFHLGFQHLKNGSRLVSPYFSDFHVIYECCGDLVLLLIVATIFSLCFEAPCLRIEAALFKKNRSQLRIHVQGKHNFLN